MKFNVLHTWPKIAAILALSCTLAVAAPDISAQEKLESQKRRLSLLEQEIRTQKRVVEQLEAFRSLSEEEQKKELESQKMRLTSLSKVIDNEKEVVVEFKRLAGLGKEGISEAEKLTLEFWREHGNDAPLDAISVDGSFAIGSDIKGFADKGDTIWEVRLGREKFSLLWINSRTKKIQTIGTLYGK